MAARRSAARRAALRRRLLVGAGALAVLGLAAGAWWWQHTLPLRRVAVVGAERAGETELVRLAAVWPDPAATPDTTPGPDSSVALYALAPRLVADRVQRHPWVRAARVRRLPTGTLEIAVTEREPVALVVGADGRPRHYLDAEGYAMPTVRGAAFDVPLLRGAVPPYHPTQPVRDGALRDLLAALADARAHAPGIDALVSEIEWTAGGARLRTAPAGAHGDLLVVLGQGEAAAKLRRLRAFVDQAVLPRPGARFQVIDLRFDGQVVTREAEPAADSAAAPTPTATAAPAAGRPVSPASPLPQEPAAEG